MHDDIDVPTRLYPKKPLPSEFVFELTLEQAEHTSEALNASKSCYRYEDGQMTSGVDLRQ